MCPHGPLAFQRLGSEFMPPLYEGTILYMPTTLPGLSVTAAAQLLQKMDRTLKSFPEVERVFGKAGRAETSTDPAPFSMMEVVVQLKPKAQWRPGLTYEGLVAEMDKALQLPGVTNAWTMPIKARIDMLTTGVRTPVGIKIFGPDLKQIEEIGKHIEMVAQEVPGTRSVYAERVSGGYFLDFDIRRDEIARYGLTVMDVGQIIESAIGGESIATTIEGRERYPINVRYPRELRDDPEKLRRVLVTTPTGAQVPLAQLTTLRVLSGPAMIRDENGMLSGYVYVDMAGRDIGGYVEDLKRVVRDKVALPPGYTIAWSGQYEFMRRVRERLKIFVPLTIAMHLCLVLLHVPFRGRDADGHARCALRSSGGRLVPGVAGIQHEHRGVGGPHCPGWGRGRDQRRDARLSGRGLRPAPSGWTVPHLPGRAAHRAHRGGGAHPAHGHGWSGQYPRADPGHVGHRYGRGRHETARGTHGRGRLVGHAPDPRGHSSALCHLALADRCQASSGSGQTTNAVITGVHPNGS